MGLRINTNVLSLNAQRNLNSTTKALGRALERLSSGSRINRAGDDAAGLAISEGLQSQVRGLRVAVRNSNDAIGFLNTAEGALSEITNITQRLRELSIQAANGTLSVSDRGYLQDEADSLIAEFDRIANQTQFNGVALLDGSFQTTDLQVGVNKGETISFTIGDARASSIGSLATKSGYQGAVSSNDFDAISINGVALTDGAAADDGVSFAGNSYSAIALAKAINAVRSQTNVKAEVQDTVITLYDTKFTSSNFSGTIDAGFKINNVTIAGSNINSAARFIDAVNDYSNSTGVKARLATGSSDDIELYAEDGRNITIGLSSYAATYSDGISMIAVASAYSTFFAAVLGDENNWSGMTATFTNATAAFSSLGSVGLFSTINTQFQQGGLSTLVRTGSVKLISSEDIVVTGTSLTSILGFAQGNYAVDPESAINEIDLTDADAASDALAVVDAALQQVTALRASLGAVQNRLESTSSNIGITLENISAARSQIRDADISSETAELTRAQILQQAGVAVLGQANAASQVALSLLRF